jgi:hypothetical protein
MYETSKKTTFPVIATGGAANVLVQIKAAKSAVHIFNMALSLKLKI